MWVSGRAAARPGMSGMAACEPKIEDDLVAGERAGAAVVQRDLDGLRADEAAARP